MAVASDFSERILGHPNDIFGALALRVTARALPLMTNAPQARKAISDKDEIFYLDLLRALLLCCNIQSKISPETSIKIAEKYDNLSRYYSYSMGIVAFRACLKLNLPLPRSEKIEELRRCTQSAYDLTANSAMRSGSRTSKMFWDRFNAHLESIELNHPKLQRAFDENDAILLGAWNRLSRSLAAKNETWKIWIEWFEFRFIGISGESVPSFLWGEVESRFVSDENKFNNDSITSCNQYFAQCALNVVEEFADFQSSAEQIAGGLQFEVGDDEQIRLSNNNSPHQGEENPSHANSIIDELLSLIGRMKIECQLNSATYLSESIDSYADAFGEKSWKDPAKVVVRGDSLRSLLNAQLNRSPGSDLPELQDKTILIFKNLGFVDKA